MDSDKTPASTRRRLLQMGALGLTTGIAGCSGDDDIGRDYNRSRDDPPPEHDPFAEDDIPRPDDPPATFQSDRGDFTYYDLLFQRELPTPSDVRTHGHPDNSLIHIEILDSNTAQTTIESVNVTRDIDLLLYVLNTDEQFRTVEQTLTASGTDTYERREVTFDISSIPLPTEVGSVCSLAARDTHPENEVEFDMHLKNHRFVGIPYKDGVHWVNSKYFNHRVWRDEEGMTQWSRIRGVPNDPRGTPAGHVEYIDTDEERILFLATHSTLTEKILGVSCHIKHQPARDYINGNDRYQWQYGPRYEASFATRISHFRELAEKTAHVISKAGITNQRGRIGTLGDFIQMIPYTLQAKDPSPTVVLYDSLGDCSAKSFLMSCILQNDPWNVVPAYIRCKVEDINHMTIGLKLDDLGLDPDFDTSKLFTVRPSEKQVKYHGFPDAEYAFFDMTYDEYIGDKHSSVSGPYSIYDEGDFSNTDGRYADDVPPDY